MPKPRTLRKSSGRERGTRNATLVLLGKTLYTVDLA
jgi:hypothetical protein